MVKEACQGVELPLKSGDLRRHDEAVIGIEKRGEGLDCCSQDLLPGALLGVPHYHHPVPDYWVTPRTFSSKTAKF